MSTDATTAQEWLEAIIPAAEELATVALGMDSCEFLGNTDPNELDTGSAYIAVVGEESSIQLGVSSSVEGCQELARALLAMDPEEEDLADEEVVDAIGEIANILAGQVKRLMAEKNSSFNLGIPIFIQGQVKPTSEMDVAIAKMRIGSIPLSLFVMKSQAEAN